jgi:hypothetical protein
MNIKKIGWGLGIVLLTTLSHASATTILNSDVTGTWAQGSGTSNGAFTIDQEANGVELGLRATIRGGSGGPITPNAGTNIYVAPTGIAGVRALWNVDFSVNTAGLEDLIALLKVTDGVNTASFDPLAIGDNAINSVFSEQNSENLTFGLFSGLNFNPNAAATYTFDLTLTDPGTHELVSSVEIKVDAVPGPTVGAGASSFALAALFLGWFVRRRGNQFA